ncbi:MAG: RecX family transcriptional regulator [Lewinellaceae bacterium]|nr:RecX family transcriptional regulator [Saprospiraceae bacterium]MCB9332328.1 RecX family transcriptional regulator [Lewinellaceae bacterium]
MAYFSKQKGNAKALTPDEALVKMENYCAYRERCWQEVDQKIKTLGITSEIAGEIRRVLQEDGYVDDARFARAFAGGKFRVNRWGRVRIRLELQRRGISPGDIESALEDIDEQEYRLVLQERLMKKRVQYQADTDPQGRAKAAAALIRSGFEPELVFRHL